ncbi:MAG: GNAT family N-acetyltransferase [Spirochaetales bacterium]|nr:GNAT family N-acetyltransferase [Spirochaetales bacterium]
MTIEPFSRNDLPALDGLRPEKWPDLVPPFRFYLSHLFCLPLEAVSGGVVAGIGAGIGFGKTGWLAHIIVRHELRGRGIGGRIVIALIDYLAKKGCRTVSLLATDMGYPLYKKYGFVDQVEYVFFARDEDDRPDPPAGGIVPYSPDYLGSILDMDREVSGEERGAILEENLDGCLLHVSGGTVAGFFLPRLGEGFAAARNKEAGLALLAMKAARAVRVTLPTANEAGIRFLLGNGYREATRCWRMVRGPEFPWKPDCVYGRIAGNLG